MIEVGSQIGDAIIEERIGEGASSTVWRARWRGRTVVVKVLHAALSEVDEWVARVRREADALRAIHSDHVVRVLDVGRTLEGLVYVVLEHIDGPTLRALLDHPKSALDAKGAARLLDALAAALESAHAAGIVHRDVKPENVMIEDDVLKLVDFGLAKPREDVAKLTMTGAPLGTPAYMAPEQWWNDGVGPEADQYAFGLVAYELLAREPPFPVTSLPEMMEAHLHKRPPPIDGAPKEVDAALQKMLAKKKSDRFASMTEARVALRVALGGSTPKRAPVVLPWVLLVLLPLATFAIGYPGARDPRVSIPLAGWAVFPVFGAYLVGTLAMRRTWFAPIVPAILGTFATYTGWRQVLLTVSHAAAADRVPILHQGLYEANVNRFFGLALTAALYVALAATFERTTLLGATKRTAALVFGLVFSLGAIGIWIRSQNDLLWTGNLTRAARTSALAESAALKGQITPLLAAGVATLVVLLTVLTLRRFREPRHYATVWRAIARGPAIVVALWLAVDLFMLSQLRAHVAEVVASQATELDLMAELDPPSAEGLPPAPEGTALKIARDRVLVDDAPVGLTAALERGGLDDVLRADLSHRLARDVASSHTLVLIADRRVSTAAVTRALEIARELGVTEVAVLYTRGPSPAIDSSSEAAAVLPTDFGSLRIQLDGLELQGESWETAAARLLPAPR